MRVAYAGTPAFAVPALEALVAAGHEVPLVLTQPDRPAGRGMRLTPSAVADAARRLGLHVEKPATMKAEESQALLAQSRPDVLVVAAFGQILPPVVLAIPRLGCINIHASLLPRWRGAAPVHRAILAGDERTGICIMSMEAGLDTGPVILRRETSIGPEDTTGELTGRLAALGAEAVVEALGKPEQWQPQPQDPTVATYAAKVNKAEAKLDWSDTNIAADRRIRAFNPAPGVEARVGGGTVKIWRAEPVTGSGSPGEVLRSEPDSLVVACGEGALRIIELQSPGGRRSSVEDFLRGHELASR